MLVRRAEILGLAIATFSFVALVFRNSIFANGPVGILVQILAALLMVWARLTFGRRSFHATAEPTEGGLVTTGPYRFLRHPIYAALLYFLWAGVLSHSTTVNLLLGGLATAGLVVRIVVEERHVVQRYPEYAAYAARTKRLIPFIF